YRQPVRHAKQILAIAGSVIRTATRDQHDVARIALADGARNLADMRCFLLDLTRNHLRLFEDLALKIRLGHVRQSLLSPITSASLPPASFRRARASDAERPSRLMTMAVFTSCPLSSNNRAASSWLTPATSATMPRARRASFSLLTMTS